MTLTSFEALLTPHGQTALAAATDLAPTEAGFLACFDKLGKRFDADLAKAAIETAILRTKAASKFPAAAKMYFVREALEQSTHHLVAMHRAKRFAAYGTVVDLGCGLGADAIALTHAGCRVIAVERDPLRARIAEANFAALGLDITVHVVDGLVDEFPPCDALFCDPARRDGDHRYLDTDAYAPSPCEVVERFRVPIGFKLAPGIARSDLARYDGEAEFVSLDGELKECALWLGPLAQCERRATILPSGASLTGSDTFEARETTPPLQFLHLPDAAVIRAGLEPVLAEQIGAAFLDGIQPLLTSDTHTATPFAKVYRLDAAVSGSLSRLADALRERGVGRVTWMNLGSPRVVETVRKSVKLKGTAHRTVILTRLGDAATALIVDRVES